MKPWGEEGKGSITVRAFLPLGLRHLLVGLQRLLLIFGRFLVVHLSLDAAHLFTVNLRKATQQCCQKHMRVSNS